MCLTFLELTVCEEGRRWAFEQCRVLRWVQLGHVLPKRAAEKAAEVVSRLLYPVCSWRLSEQQVQDRQLMATKQVTLTNVLYGSHGAV
jgi:hypothetical protein